MSQSFGRSLVAQITEVSGEAVLLTTDTLFNKERQRRGKAANLQMSCTQLDSPDFFGLKNCKIQSQKLEVCEKNWM